MESVVEWPSLAFVRVVVADADPVSGELGASGAEGGKSENPPEDGDRGDCGEERGGGRERSYDLGRRRDSPGVKGRSAAFPPEDGWRPNLVRAKRASSRSSCMARRLLMP